MKSSNRFLIGVPDILCQLPERNTSFWEVKYSPHARWKCPDLTVKQKMWLRDFTKSGGMGGVIYFCASANDMTFAIKWAWYFDRDAVRDKWRIPEDEFIVLPRGSKMQPFKEELNRMYEELI